MFILTPMFVFFEGNVSDVSNNDSFIVIFLVLAILNAIYGKKKIRARSLIDLAVVHHNH